MTTRKNKKSNKFRKTRSKRHKGGTPPSPPSIEYMIDAIEQDEEEQVKDLLEMGADVNATEPSNGNTPLIVASASNLPKIVEMLLAAGADVNGVNDEAKTALDIAKETECSKKIQLPLKRHNIEKFIPRHLQTLQNRKKDKIKLTWALREKDVGNRGDGTMPYDLRRKIGEYLGGKRKSKKSKKSKRKTRKTRKI